MWSRRPRRSCIVEPRQTRRPPDVAGLPRDRDLVRLYWPVELRPAFNALFAIDDALGDVVTRASEPALAAIKLAWWRERLEELDEGKVPAEPRLRAAVAELLPRGVSGAALAGLEAGWAALLDEQPASERVTERGAGLFAMAASLLGVEEPLIETAGRLFGWQCATRRGFALPQPENDLRALAGHRFYRRLRPLTALAALAARDARRGQPIEPEGTPGRALALIRHRLTGRVA